MRWEGYWGFHRTRYEGIDRRNVLRSGTGSESPFNKDVCMQFRADGVGRYLGRYTGGRYSCTGQVGRVGWSYE